MLTPPDAKLKHKFNRKGYTSKPVTSTNKGIVEPDADTDKAPVGEGVNRWSESNPSVSPSPDSFCRSYSPSDRRGPRRLRPSAAGQRRSMTDLSRPPLRKGQGGLVNDNWAPNVRQRWWRMQLERRTATARQVHCGLVENPRWARNNLAPNAGLKLMKGRGAALEFFCGFMERPLLEEGI